MSNRRDFLRQNLTFSGETDFESVNLTGNIGVDGGTPAVSLDLGNRTDSIVLPKGTNAQRPTSQVGMLRYNTELTQYEIYDSVVGWVKIGDLPPEASSVSPGFPDFSATTTDFVITGNNFDQGTTVVLIAPDTTEITPDQVTFNSTGQVTVTVTNTNFLVYNTPGDDTTIKEPYDIKVTKTSGLVGTLENAIYVDTKPTWNLTDSTTLTTVYGIYRDQGVEVTLPTSTDPDGDTVTYGAVNLPTGLSIDSSTGVISGLTESVTEYTTSNFTVQAKSTSGDAQNLGEQTTSRTVNIIRTPEVLNSLRFDGSSYLDDTLGTATDANVFTFSAWVKRSALGQYAIFGSYQDASNRDVLRFTTSDALEYQVGNSGNFYNHTSTALFRDSNTWYHIVLAVNWSTQLLNVYVNNTSVANEIFGGFSQPSTNRPRVHYVGARNAGAGVDSKYSGYIADVYFIDGQKLNPSNFGQTVDGMWVPKQYSGSNYGVNGFHLDFSPDNLVFNGNTLQTVKDIAPIGGTHTTANDWAAN